MRLQENRAVNIALMKGNLVVNNSRAAGGVSARVWKHGAWGFSSAPGHETETLKKVLAAAAKNADFLDSRLKKGRPAPPHSKGAAHHDHGTRKPRLSQKELVDFARELDSYITGKYPDLKGRRVTINLLDMEKAYLNSYASACYSPARPPLPADISRRSFSPASTGPAIPVARPRAACCS